MKTYAKGLLVAVLLFQAFLFVNFLTDKEAVDLKPLVACRHCK